MPTNTTAKRKKFLVPDIKLTEEDIEINEQEEINTETTSEPEVNKESNITPPSVENDADDDIDSFFG